MRTKLRRMFSISDVAYNGIKSEAAAQGMSMSKLVEQIGCEYYLNHKKRGTLIEDTETPKDPAADGAKWRL